MIKAAARFVLFLFICLLFVYAPEILDRVSAPYSLQTPQRALLRIALCCEDEQTVSSLYKSLSSYQKTYPSVHLRITRVSPEQLAAMQPPHPDVFLLPEACVSALPVAPAYTVCFSPAADARQLLCAVSTESIAREIAIAFAAHLYEASAVQNAPADF